MLSVMTSTLHRTLSLVLLSLVAGCGTSHAADDSGVAVMPDAQSTPDAPSTPDDAAQVPDAATTGDAAGRPFVDLIVQLRDFDAFEGSTATVRATDTSIGETHGPVSATLVGGDADVTLVRGFVRDLFGEIGHVWIDANGDGTCSPDADVVYSFFINNDFEMGPETVVVTAGDPLVEAATCADAGE